MRRHKRSEPTEVLYISIFITNPDVYLKKFIFLSMVLDCIYVYIWEIVIINLPYIAYLKIIFTAKVMGKSFY